MGALASCTKWNPEDDLLLKNAVEAGASLESLAKGAVHFSRRFTIQELEERWSSLLYDLNTSTEASARIVEIEIGVSVFNPSKHGRACKVKETLSGRRKGESLLCHYFASRKKARNEPHKSSNLGFLVPPSSDAVLGHESGSHDQFKLQNEFAIDKFPGGMPFSNDYGHPETIYGGSQHAYSKMVEIESTAVTSSHVFHGGMVGSIESGVPDGISSRDVLFGHPENISTFTIDEAGYKGVGENFESNLTQKDFPHSLDRNHCSSQTSGVPESRPLQSLALNDPNVNGDIEAKPSADFALTNNEQGNIYSDFGGNHNPVSKFAGSSPSFHQLGYSTLPPGLPIWKTIEDVSTPTLQMDGHFEEKCQVVLTMESIKKIDDQACDDATPKSKLNDGTSCAALNNSTILSEDNFIDFSSSCMSFTEDEELLFIDVDDDDIGDRSCLNGLSSIFLSSPSDTHMDNLPNPSESKPSEAFNTSIPACNIESSMEHETMHDEINTGSSNLDTMVVPGVRIISASSVASPTAAPVETSMICVLNTEDLEVPCNDDVRFSAKLCQTFATCRRNDSANTLANDGKATSGGLALVIGGKVASLQPNASNFKAGQQLPKVGLLHSTADYVQDDESSDRDAASGASRIFNKDMDDPDSIPPTVTSYSAPDIALKHETSTELNMQAPLPKCMPSHLEIVSTELGCVDLLPSVSISDQEEQFVEDDEYDVPNFSDVEAMILDMDLGPYDQESCLFSKEVSRYQCLDTKKTIIRLEQGTRSYMNRAISSHGAFAVFYGRHLKYFIQTPEVLLGRETEDIKVDIDLGKEGRANKISRRQAIIKMDGDGTFHLKNIGKSSIFVNSKEVPVKKRINLCSRALIEIKDMRFIFEVNDLAVRRHIASLQQISQGPKSEYDFVCTSELHG